MPFFSEGGLPSPGGKQPDTELERKEYKIIFFLAWFQYLNCDLMAWMEFNPVFLTGLTFLIAWMGVGPDIFTRLGFFLGEKVERFLCQQRTNLHAVKLSCFSHLVFIWDYATNLILMRLAQKSQSQKLCELLIFLLHQSLASSAILFQRQKLLKCCSNKVLWSFQISPCPRAEGTRAPTIPVCDLISPHLSWG